MTPLTVILLICSLFNNLEASSDRNSFVQRNLLEAHEPKVTFHLLDRLSTQDPQYLEYLRLRRSHTRSNTKLTPIAKLLAKPDFMETVTPQQLQDWLLLRDTSIWDAIKIIESPNFNGVGLDFLNSLPCFYLNRRLLIPYEAFLRRFKFTVDKTIVSATSNAFSNLGFKFLETRCVNDPTFDDFFKILLETQSEPFETFEQLFFDKCLRGGSDSWRFLKYYFEISLSESKSESLIKVLISINLSGPVTSDLIKYILSFKNFDPNTKINQQFYFFHILVLQYRLTKPFLCHVLKDPRLDVNVPTGEVVFECPHFDPIVFENKPIIFLAAVFGNIWALKDLIGCGRLEIRLAELIYFLILHMLNFFLMVVKSKFNQRLFNKSF